MYSTLSTINSRPKVFGHYTAKELWTNPYTAKQMLTYHLNSEIDVSSRNHQFIDTSVQWIIQHFGLNGTSLVGDFGCGPGLYTQRLATSGIPTCGIDFSRNSIDYAQAKARETGVPANYVCSDYLAYQSTDRFDLIIMIMCDFCVLSPTQRATLLSVFKRHLKDNGRILLDVYSLDAFDKKEESATYEKNQLNSFWSEKDYYTFVNTFKYAEEKVSLDKYTIYVEGAPKEKVVYNWLKHFSPESLTKEVEDNGLSVVSVLGNVAGAPYDPLSDEFAVVLKNRENG